MKNFISVLFYFLNKSIKKISKIYWRNSIRLGKAMPMKRPRPPPMLLRKVNPSVLGIWVIFSVLKSRKDKVKSVSPFVFGLDLIWWVYFSEKQLLKGHSFRQLSNNSVLISVKFRSLISHCLKPRIEKSVEWKVQLYLFLISL